MLNLKLSEYQSVTGTTAIYPEAGTRSLLALAYTALGASNEAGEVAGKIKKVIRDGYGDDPESKKLAILDEVGDTLWYLAQVCSELGLNIEDAASRNVAKLSSRASRGVLGGSGDTR